MSLLNTFVKFGFDPACQNWDKYQPERDLGQEEATERDTDGPHCEDEDFNMDADYNPKQARLNLMEELKSTMNKKRRNRKKKSKLASLLSTDKPKFVPAEDKTYDQYMEEYYQMDCEDVIAGEIPTRFKYRSVVPNDYGLSIEEILLADDKELTQWVPLKRIVKHRAAEVEKSDVHTYRQKAADVNLKKKMLPSLFKDLPEEPEIVVSLEETIKKKKKKKKSKKKAENIETVTHNVEEREITITNDVIEGNTETKVKFNSDTSKKEKKKRKKVEISMKYITDIDETSPEKNKKKIINDDDTNNEVNGEDKKQEVKIEKKHKEVHQDTSKNLHRISDTESIKEGKRKKNKHKSDGFVVEDVDNQEPSSTQQQIDVVSESNKQKNKDKNKLQNQHNLKRKIDTNMDSQVPHKKTKNQLFNPKGSGNKKDTNNKKKKFKQKDGFANKQNNDKSSDNPLSKLSDERLKAYGLNPKKYRSFLKYKKF